MPLISLPHPNEVCNAKLNHWSECGRPTSIGDRNEVVAKYNDLVEKVNKQQKADAKQQRRKSNLMNAKAEALRERAEGLRPVVNGAEVSVRTEPIVKIENLIVEYRSRGVGSPVKMAVNQLNLRIEKGEVFGFLGPNGAGKTTTMNVLLGFIRASRGSNFPEEGFDALI